MNKVMTDNINNVVCKGGWLYHLGDWSFGPIENAIEFRNTIRSDINIVLIVGNHDARLAHRWQFKDLFDSICDMKEVSIGGQRIVLCHYAMRVWNKSHHGTWHLYGHSHGTLSDDPNSLSFDVGVDCHKFTPLTFAQVGAIMGRKTWRPINHHRGNYDTTNI